MATAEHELTAQELSLQLSRYIRFLWAKKGWIVAAAFISAAIFFYRTWEKPFLYTAQTSFMVNEESGGSSSGIGALLGQFGLGMGGSSDFNLDKIVELGQSRYLIQQAFWDTAFIDGQRDLLANHLIRVQQFHQEWRRDSLLRNFLFTSADPQQFDRTANDAMLRLYAAMVGSQARKIPGLLQINYADESGILQLSVKTRSEALSLALAASLYTALSEFYIKKTTEKQAETVRMLNTKADSIYTALNKAEYSLAQRRDRSLGLLEQRLQVDQSRLAREVQVLTIMYGEAIKNRETADFLLKSTTPFFQLIDEAIGPLAKERESVIKSSVIGAVVGGLLTSLWFLFLGFVWPFFRSLAKEE